MLGRYAAAFSLDDPDALVGASLSCPRCLDGATRLAVDVIDGQVSAICACRACGSTWSLALEPQQALRLSLDPPRDADVSFCAHLPPSLMPDALDG